MKKKRVLFEVPEEIQIEIKDQARRRNMTVKKWILRHLLYAIKKDHEANSVSN